MDKYIESLNLEDIDFKKFDDFKEALEVFKKELPDQEISLAETYSPQIF